MNRFFNSRAPATRRATKQSIMPKYSGKEKEMREFCMVIMASVIARGCARTATLRNVVAILMG